MKRKTDRRLPPAGRSCLIKNDEAWFIWCTSDSREARRPLVFTGPLLGSQTCPDRSVFPPGVFTRWRSKRCIRKVKCHVMVRRFQRCPKIRDTRHLYPHNVFYLAEQRRKLKTGNWIIDVLIFLPDMWKHFCTKCQISAGESLNVSVAASVDG